jgi:Family of unknown function (DUF5317)
VLMIAAFLLCVTAIPLLGGSLRQLGTLKLRGLGLAVVGLFVQIVVISVVPGGNRAVHEALHVASYAPLLAFCLLNRKVRGVLVVGLGTVLNVAAIAANHGVMPAQRGALRFAGLSIRGGFANSAPVAHPRLAWLGDVFGTPSALPLHNVFSVGDLLIVGGAAVVVFAGSGVGRKARHLAGVAADADGPGGGAEAAVALAQPARR